MSNDYLWISNLLSGVQDRIEENNSERIRKNLKLLKKSIIAIQYELPVINFLAEGIKNER